MGQETPMALTRAESIMIASYVVDLEVKERVLMVPKWAARQVVLTGQTLEVMDGEKLKFACNTTYCTTRLLEPLDSNRFFPFQLLEHGKVKLTLNAPTASAREDFLSHLEKSVVSDTWAVETKDTWDTFLSVAVAINEKKAIEGKFRIKPSKVSIQRVTLHMLEMKEVYDVVAGLPDVDSLYELFLGLERDYSNGVLGNFAHTVHLLHPVLYSKGRKSAPPLVDILTRCPRASCGAALPLSMVYLMHIRNQAIKCPTCGRGILYETYNLAAFVRSHPSFTVNSKLRNTAVEYIVEVPDVPGDGTWTTFLVQLQHNIAAGASAASTAGVATMRSTIRAAVKAYRQNVLGRFHLDLVQGMFRQLDFVNKMCPHFEYWTHPDVVAASIARYDKFMHLMTVKDRGVILVPTSDIDLVWHTHQTSPAQYAAFCSNLLSRQTLLDHDDTIEGGDLAKGYADTFVLWSQTFGEAYSSFPPSYEAWVKDKSTDPITRLVLRKKWAKHGAVPARDNRFFGVNEAYPVDAMPYAVAVTDANATKPEGDAPLPVYVTVIGTPVMDGRVRQPYSRHTVLMYDAGLPYYYMPYMYVGGCGGFGYYGVGGGCGVSGTAYGADGGCGTFAGDGGCASGGCGAGGCATGGCSTGCGGGGGCGGCGGCGG